MMKRMMDRTMDRKIKHKDVAPILSYDPDIEAETAKHLDED